MSILMMPKEGLIVFRDPNDPLDTTNALYVPMNGMMNMFTPLLEISLSVQVKGIETINEAIDYTIKEYQKRHIPDDMMIHKVNGINELHERLLRRPAIAVVDFANKAIDVSGLVMEDNLGIFQAAFDGINGAYSKTPKLAKSSKIGFTAHQLIMDEHMIDAKKVSFLTMMNIVNNVNAMIMQYGVFDYLIITKESGDRHCYVFSMI